MFQLKQRLSFVFRAQDTKYQIMGQLLNFSAGNLQDQDTVSINLLLKKILNTRHSNTVITAQVNLCNTFAE